MLKKILALFLLTLLSFSTAPAFAAGGGESNDYFYQAVTELVSSRWDDGYFGTATLSIGSDVLDVDGRPVILNNEAEVLNNELILPAEVFEALGAYVSGDADRVYVSNRASGLSITSTGTSQTRLSSPDR